MLADNKGMDAAAVYPQMLAEGIFQPRRIKDCARANHLPFREPANLHRSIGQDIHGIRDHQKYPFKPAF
jgi:hypothetical protein